MIVYVDQIFIVNFITDFVLLHIACGFSGRRKLRYTIAASAAGALYASFMYIPSAEFLSNPLLKMLVFIAMVAISARPKSFEFFVKNLLCFSAVSMFLGGGVFALLLTSGYSVSDVLNNSITVFDAKTPVLLLAFGIVAMVGYAAMVAVFKAYRVKTKTVKLEIKHGDRKVRLYGLVDTGCTLCEPGRKRPVIIVDYRVGGDFIKDNTDICLIPYSTVDSNGTFMGFYPDYVKIGRDVFRDVAVAVCYTGAMEEKQYSAIINSDIFKEESCVA